jgi:hypothetical protein
MSNSLKNDLVALKNRLEDIEAQIEVKASNVIVRQEKWNLLESEVKKVIAMNRNRKLITLNVGGTKFVTLKETLLSSKDSLLERFISSNRLDTNNEIFFDRSPKYFPVLLEYIRTKKVDYTKYTEDELKVIRDEANYFNIVDICKYMEDRLKDVEFVSIDFSKPYTYGGVTAGTNIVDNLNDRICMSGICTDSNGWIIVELNNEWDFEEIEIGGWKGNSNLWYCGNGSGAVISTSRDKLTWKEVGSIPSSFGNSVTTAKVKKSTARYIKFSHNSYLGIGYLKVKKLKTK